MNLTINDLATMANVIDIATQRGAFRANELRAIGELYDKLSGFVKAAQEQAKKEEEAAAKSDKAANPPTDPGQGE